MILVVRQARIAHPRDALLLGEPGGDRLRIVAVALHAQRSAEAFYTRLGYLPHGEPFEEAGIAHIEMRRKLSDMFERSHQEIPAPDRTHALLDGGEVVSADRTWDTVGGGNLEALAIERARAMVADGVREPETLEVALSDKAPYQHGVQCCGGEVTVPGHPTRAVVDLGAALRAACATRRA